MSEVYISRLTRIQKEYDAAQGALEYAIRGWQREALFAEPELELISPQELRRCEANLEPIFIIYLFSAFEDILRSHLQSHHPHLSIPEEEKAVRLIDRVAMLQRPRIVGPLRERVHDVRRSRNQLVHASVSAQTLRISLSEVLARLIKFVDQLPEPYER